MLYERGNGMKQKKFVPTEDEGKKDKMLFFRADEELRYKLISICKQHRGLKISSLLRQMVDFSLKNM